MFMSSAFSVLLTFLEERAVFLREYAGHMYSVSAYYFGRSYVEILFIITVPCLFSLVSCFIISLNNYTATKFFLFGKVYYS